MLIDQIDLMVDPEFFGNIYCPHVLISSDKIRKLLEKVWKQYRNNKNITEKQLVSCPQFKELKYLRIFKIIQNQIRGMILGCRGSNHDYVLSDGLIKYKSQDGLTSKINYGFNTMFAYFQEYDKLQICPLVEALNIKLDVAQLSYSKLPKYYGFIIGLTSNYEKMPYIKKCLLRDKYEISDYYIIPSIYRDVKRLKLNQTKVVGPDYHWQCIVKQIKTVHLTERPILVFFKNTLELFSLFNSQQYKQLKEKTGFLCEAHLKQNISERIREACQKNKITFMTKQFSRGTDFIVNDQSIKKIEHGGIHVIQTFLSVKSLEQLQIQGRAARQGDPGTYSLIINLQELQRLKISHIKSINLQNELKQARKTRQEYQISQQIKRLKQVQMKHKKSIQAYSIRRDHFPNLFLHYIGSLNSFQSIRNQACRTVIMIDGANSMQNLFKKLISILDEVINDVIEITKQRNVKTSFIQLFVYRNYNCPYEIIFQSTPFETESKYLIKFLKQVSVDGGIGRNAIELGYWHVNKVGNLDQVIIIGDAPPNTIQKTIEMRKKRSQLYWNRNNIPIRSSEKQLDKIILKGIPIHSFYINTQQQLETKQYFQSVSKKTSGFAQQFLINAYGSSKKLSQFITQRILQKVGKDTNQGKNMIDQYREKHQL